MYAFDSYKTDATEYGNSSEKGKITVLPILNYCQSIIKLLSSVLSETTTDLFSQ